MRGLPWAHAQHPKVSTTRATVCAGFVPPALTSPRGPGGELRPCGPCNVGTLWRHHKDTCPSLQVQRKVYALCRISLDFHKNPELKNEILSQMRKTSERKLRELQRPGRSPPCCARRLACEAFLSALQGFILASGSPWFCELLAALVRFVTIY